MSEGRSAEQSARRWADGWVWAAVVVAVGIRIAALWGIEDPSLCTRDECIFRDAARTLLDGERLPTAPAGWLPAPGYPWLLALCGVVFGRVTAMREVQIGLTPLLVLGVASLARQAGGDRGARLAAWAIALHPTLIFFSVTTWTETVYSLLLVGVAWSTLAARRGPLWRPVLAGVVLGMAVLARGVATWLAPIVAIGLWMSGPRRAPPRRGRRLVAWAMGLAMTVGPWSVHASRIYGGPVLSDATAGYVAWLGNGESPPIRFHYGIGPVSRSVYLQQVGGRPPPCGAAAGPVARDRCLMREAWGNIRAAPGTFLARVPLRMAQLFNPHTFLTRHVRWRYAPAIPPWVGEILVILTALTSLVITWGGAVGAWARARGPLAVVTVGVVAYHVAVIAGLYGVSRFRLPLEPLMVVWLAALIARPGRALAALHASPGRRWGLILSLPPLIVASLWFAWTAWPGLLW